MALSLVLADDHPIVRRGLREVLSTLAEVELVGEATDGLEALRLVEKVHPDVLILDLMMPGMNGWDVAREVRNRSPQTRIIVLSMYPNEAYVVAALRAGAQAYVLKEADIDDLIKAIQSVKSGRRFLSAPISEEGIEHYLKQEEETPLKPAQRLTTRERQVLQMTIEGQSSNEIARRLFISRRTVETHRANLMRKLNVRNLKELVRVALEQNIIPRPPMPQMEDK